MTQIFLQITRGHDDYNKNLSIGRHEPSCPRFEIKPGCQNTCFLTSWPLYSYDSLDETTRTIYFEVKILPSSAGSFSLALGFSLNSDSQKPSLQWPDSVRVHSDGYRCVNNEGELFTGPFVCGEVVGIGMEFSPSKQEMPNHRNVHVFFTRNGHIEREWTICGDPLVTKFCGTHCGHPYQRYKHSNDCPILWLQGWYSLYGMVGTSSGSAVDFKVMFLEKDWLYKPGGG
jgi:hypothetical protein